MLDLIKSLGIEEVSRLIFLIDLTENIERIFFKTSSSTLSSKDIPMQFLLISLRLIPLSEADLIREDVLSPEFITIVSKKCFVFRLYPSSINDSASLMVFLLTSFAIDFKPPGP